MESMENLVYVQINNNSMQSKAIIAMLQTMDFAKILTPDKVQITITEKNHALSVSDMKLELIRFILSLSDESVMYLYNIIKSTYETENELLEKLGKGFEVVKSMENKLKTNGIINPNL